MVYYSFKLYCCDIVRVKDGRLVYPDSKVHGANMGPTWVLSASVGPHIGLMNLSIKVVTELQPMYVHYV